MISISTQAHQLISEMSESVNFKNVTFTSDYEYGAKPTPITSPIISVTVKGCEIGEKDETNNRTVNLTIGADIYVPFNSNYKYVYSFFENIVNFLMSSNPHPITKVTCGDVTYDKSCEALVIKSSFVFTTTEWLP